MGTSLNVEVPHQGTLGHLGTHSTAVGRATPHWAGGNARLSIAAAPEGNPVLSACGQAPIGWAGGLSSSQRDAVTFNLENPCARSWFLQVARWDPFSSPVRRGSVLQLVFLARGQETQNGKAL